jgi:hypothetical protein
MDSAILGAIIQALATVLAATIATLLGIRTINNASAALVHTQENRRSDAYTTLLAERRELGLAVAGDRATAEWLIRMFGLKVRRGRSRRMYILTMLMIDHYQDVHFRASRGLMPAELWARWRMSMKGSFEEPIFKDIMASRFARAISEEFGEYVRRGFPLDPRLATGEGETLTGAQPFATMEADS